MPNRAASRARAAVLTCGLVATAGAGAATLAEPFSASYRHPAIEYGTRPRTDRVAALNERLRTGAATLRFDRRRGFLPAVLDALDLYMVDTMDEVLKIALTEQPVPKLPAPDASEVETVPDDQITH